MNVEKEIGEVLAALYLRGLRREHDAPRKRWPQVDHALRCGIRSGPFDPAATLAEAGLWFEASVLRSPCLLTEATGLVASGRVITPADEAYPGRWRLLGPSAPPAVWRRGALAEGLGPMFTIVGSRSIPAKARSVARAAGMAVASAGGTVVSGGAAGCDREAAAGARAWAKRAGVASPVVEVLPYGVALGGPAGTPCSYGVTPISSGVQVSVAAPTEGFSSALAMERNALLYAASERSLVVACRFREGGTWAGAVDALRRRIGSIWVWQDGSPGARALVALGAIPVRSVEAFVAGEAPARSLFA